MCIICGNEPSDTHHIFSRASYGRVKAGYDNVKNVVKLCRQHHSESHNIGQQSFFAKYKIEEIYQQAKLEYQKWNGTHKKVNQIK